MSLRTLLGYLDGLGVLLPDDAVPSSVDRLVEEFRDHLLPERGEKASSAGKDEATARMFLSERSEPLEAGLAGVSGARSAFSCCARRGGALRVRRRWWCARCARCRGSCMRGG